MSNEGADKIREVIKKYYNKKEVLVIYNLATMAGLHPTLFDRFTKKWDDMENVIDNNSFVYTYIYSGGMAGINTLVPRGVSYFDERMCKYNNKSTTPFSDQFANYAWIRSLYGVNKLEYFSVLTDSLRHFIVAQKAAAVNGIKEEMEKEEPDMGNIISLLNKMEKTDYENIDADARLELIDLFSHQHLSDDKETLIINLLDYIRSQDLTANESEYAERIAKRLEGKSYYKNGKRIHTVTVGEDGDVVVAGLPADQPFIMKLLLANGGGIDDKTLMYGKNNYTRVMGVFVKLLFHTQRFRKLLPEEDLDFWENMKRGFFLGGRIVQIKYASFGERAVKTAGNAAANMFTLGLYDLLTEDVSGFTYKQSRISRNDQGKVVIKTVLSNGTENETLDEKIFKPFEPIIILNDDELPEGAAFGYKSLEEITTAVRDKKVLFVPAITGEYLDDKMDDKIIKDVIDFAGNVLTIATGGLGVIAKSTNLFFKAVLIADYVGAVAGLTNLTLNGIVGQNNNPLNGILSTINICGGTFGILNIFSSASKGAQALEAAEVLADEGKLLEGLEEVYRLMDKTSDRYLYCRDQIASKLTNGDLVKAEEFIQKSLVGQQKMMQRLLLTAKKSGKTSAVIKKMENTFVALKKYNDAGRKMFSFRTAFTNLNLSSAGQFMKSVDNLMAKGKIVIKESLTGNIKEVFYRFKNSQNALVEAKIGRVSDDATTIARDANNVPNAVTKEVLGNSRIGCNNGLCNIDDNCVLENTLITTENGYKPAADVQEGEMLLTYDEAKKQTVYNRVLSVIKSGASKLIRLTVNGEKLTLTDYHPVYALAKNSQSWKYTAASALINGMTVLSLNGAPATIDKIEVFDSVANVVNFELESNHNYAIGKNAILIHNACFYSDEFAEINRYTGFADGANNPTALFQKFTEYFSGNTAMLAKFNANPNLIRAWEIIHKAVNNASGITQLAKDEKVLARLAKMAEPGSAFRAKFPVTWADELEKIVSTNKNLKCATCTGGYVHRSSMDEFLEEVDYFVANFNVGTNGMGQKFYNWSKGIGVDGNPITNLNLPIFDELSQTMSFIKRSGYKEADFEGFGVQIGQTGKYCDFKFKDVKRFIELKSYKKGAAAGDIAEDGLDVLKGLEANPLKNRTQFYEQFRDGYLSTIDNLDDLTYVFELRKLGANGLDFMKKQFRDLFKAKASDLFESGKFTPAKLEALFGTSSKAQFLQDVENLDDMIYNFIRVE